MNFYLYKIERTDQWGYDEYDAAVVVARNKESARRIHPQNFQITVEGVYYRWNDGWELVRGEDVDANVGDTGWTSIENIKATLLGHAIGYAEESVILVSFNAG